MKKRVTTILGVILLLLGLLGFVSNPLIGENAIFAADAAHNVVHLVLGGILLGVALWSTRDPLPWLKTIGAILFILGVLGILTVPAIGGSLLGLVYTNGHYNWFHLIGGAVIFVAGVYGK